MTINVTKPFLAPLEEYQSYVEGIWDRGWLTNHGPLVASLEQNLRDYLRLKNLLFVSNGTIALQIALRALDVRGEVITTPFSYVATTSSLVWEGFTPVMADICPDSLNIDPGAIEAAITTRTCAILATHVYGNPCNIHAISTIAQKYGLKVIYDGAHAFGSKYEGRSLFDYGDISTASFHATKLFHTIEGGAIIASTADVSNVASQMRNFGHISPTDFVRVGINGKNSEFHAAAGLCNLKYIDQILARRKHLSARYDERLMNLVARPRIFPGCDYNHAYYPIILENEAALLRVVTGLERSEIYPRRYFYPSLNTLPYLNRKDRAPIAENIARRVLCLPLFHSLSEQQVDLVSTQVVQHL